MTDVDGFLEALVGLAEGDVGFGVPLTLTVGGLLVSGTVISRKRYYELFAEGIRQGLPAMFDTDARNRIAACFAPWTQVTEPKEDQPATLKEPEEQEPRPASRVIHLGNVQFFHPAAAQPIPRNAATCWRGRLDAINGFILGTLT